MTIFPSRQVALELLGFEIHWYGLLYLAAFLLAYVLLKKFQKFRSLTLSNDEISSVLSWVIIGVIVGGRLGFVLFYEPVYFLQNPFEAFAVWNGGMSSHGGFIGVGLALLYILRKKQIPLLAFLDVATVPIAIGLTLGRLGNFINWELYGTVTDVPWAMQIPGVEGLRHPTFFYAMVKDLWIAAVCLVVLRSQKTTPGFVISLFLIMYGVLRFIVELYREQTFALTDLGLITLTRGQLLSVPIILGGVGLFFVLRMQRRKPENLKT